MTDTTRAALILGVSLPALVIGVLAFTRAVRWSLVNALACTMQPGRRYTGWRWNMIRAYVFDRDDGKCVVCGVAYRTMDCHHRRPVGMGGGYKTRNLETRCRRCHRDAHPGNTGMWT